MKLFSIFAMTALLFYTTNGYAKGGCSGHGCGHGGHVAVVAGHCSEDDDAFRDLRGKICSGYIVYSGDTLSGIIVCADNKVSIKVSPEQDSTYMYGINDTGLTAVMITENNRELFMTRLVDKKLYRVFHTGKLSVYDTWFSFDYRSNEFYNEASRVVYNSQSEKLNSFWTTSVKRKLVSDVNKAYGLNLKPRQYNKRALLDYVSALD